MSTGHGDNESASVLLGEGVFSCSVNPIERSRASTYHVRGVRINIGHCSRWGTYLEVGLTMGILRLRRGVVKLGSKAAGIDLSTTSHESEGEESFSEPRLKQEVLRVPQFLETTTYSSCF